METGCLSHRMLRGLLAEDRREERGKLQARPVGIVVKKNSSDVSVE